MESDFKWMDASEFKIKVIPLNRKMMGFATRFLGNREDAKDLLQEVFLKLWKMKESLDQYENLEAFIIRMVKNQCIDNLRSRKTVPLYEQVEENLIDQEKANNEKEHNDRIERIKQQLSLLPEKQRLIMQLKDIEGYDYEEISDIMQMNINAIRVDLSRARKKIRELYLNNYGTYTG